MKQLKIHGLTHSFEGPPDTKENRIMDLKLEYQTFKAKPSEILSKTYTRYETLLNELANDSVNLSKHEINSSQQTQNSQPEPKIQKDYKTEYKKIKAKLTFLEASASTSQNPKTSQSKNKCLFVETFDWDEEEVLDVEELTQVKVLMALIDDELTVGRNHAHNGEWIDITMRKVNILLSMDEDAVWQNYLKYINVDLKYVEEQRLNLLSKYNRIFFELNKCRDDILVLKQAKLEVVTFQIQNTKLTKLNHALQEQFKEERKINKNWLTSSKKVRQCIREKIPNQKKKILRGEMLTESSSKKDVNENLFIPTSMDYDHEMVLKSKDWVERLNPDRSFTKLRGTVTVSETKPTTPLVPTKVKNTKQELKINELTKLVMMLIDEKVNSTQKTQESKPPIQQTESSKSVDSLKLTQPNVLNSGSSKSLRPKPIQKPQLKCELCHYTNYSTDDCYRIFYYMICKKEDHRTSDHEMYTASLKRSENYKA
nr:retrovirus-related Pol polyprotein from transposon TNT 1-94 [Tanacetum cinerariifolium]